MIVIGWILTNLWYIVGIFAICFAVLALLLLFFIRRRRRIPVLTRQEPRRKIIVHSSVTYPNPKFPSGNYPALPMQPSGKIRIISQTVLATPEPLGMVDYTTTPAPIKIKPVEQRGPEAELEAEGWKRNGRNMVGNISGKGKWHEARVERLYNNTYKVYVKAVPKSILDSSHGVCFNPMGGGWYFAHMSDCDPEDPITQVRTVQKYFTENC